MGERGGLETILHVRVIAHQLSGYDAPLDSFSRRSLGERGGLETILHVRVVP